MPTTPLVLADNVFDTYNLYTAATMDAISFVAGRDPFHIADYRRDRSWWQPTTDGGGTNPWVRVDLGAGITRAADFLFIDRGHNLWGRSVNLQGGDDGAAWPTSFTRTVPALGTVGGDPTTATMAVTEEGALYSLITAGTPRRWWRITTTYSAAFIPILTGVMAGLRNQLLGYSTIFDEDASERTPPGDTSAAGYRGSNLLYSWRTCELGLKYIGATEYDTTIRTLRRLLFEKNQPFALFMDYLTNPERGWLFQYDGTTWGLPKTRVYREGRLRGREVGAALP